VKHGHNNATTYADYGELYRQELEELNKPYTEEEIELHLHHREWKSVMEMIHAHNWQLILLCLEWRDYLKGKCKRPSRKISKYVNPHQSSDINNACLLIRELILLMCKYGEGNCPQARINTYCSRSTATLIDQLGILKHSKHLTRADCAATKLFKYATYRGDPTMTPDEFRETLYALSRTFAYECAANAEELADFTAQAVAQIEGEEAARVFRSNCQPITREEATALISQDGDKTRKAVKKAKTDLTSVVYKATNDKHEGCHHPNKQKDKIVQKVIAYLATPGVTYSINNACCKVVGKRKDGVCKESWLYDWTHRHEREIFDAVKICKATLS